MEYQEVFNNLINSGKAINRNQCIIDVPLDNEIDLSELNNKNVEEIYFVDGNISQIYNVPRGIKKIVINNNKLKQIPHLELKDLVHLEANNNNLSTVDFNNMTNLVSLFLNNNRIRKINKLPSSLKTLHISGNMLDELNLNGADSCTTVNCKNNPMLQQIISANPDFKLDKDSHHVIVLKGGSKSPKNNIDVKTAVNNYYELKKKYEDSKIQSINTIKNQNIDKKEKKKKIKKIKLKCINCDQNGGTSFWKDENYLNATCGNTKTPCNLSIRILSCMNLSENDIRTAEDELHTAKQNIIKLKLDTLFGYIDEKTSVKKFKENIKIIENNNIIDINKTLSFFEIQNDSKKQNFIRTKMNIIYNELSEIRNLMDEYNQNKNKKLLEDIAIKHKTINNNLTIIRSVKYPIHEVLQETLYNLIDDENNFIDKTKATKTTLNVLKQYPYSFDDFLNPNLEMLEVMKYTTLQKTPVVENDLSNDSLSYDSSWGRELENA